MVWGCGVLGMTIRSFANHAKPHRPWPLSVDQRLTPSINAVSMLAISSAFSTSRPNRLSVFPPLASSESLSVHLKRFFSFLNEGSEHGCEQTLPGHKGV